MLKMIVGVKGTGKTKTLISMVNAATELSAGSVVCIEKGTNLRFNVKYQARLINVDEYSLTDAQSLYGFIAGVYASNQDITHIFVDGTYRICNKNIVEFEKFVLETAKFADEADINVVMTVSMPLEDIPESVKQYM
ncbi:MAG: ATP-binding protein [Clostridia bacterium]|nr:ATP-binding protein [Clostridia bacterium]